MTDKPGYLYNKEVFGYRFKPITEISILVEKPGFSSDKFYYIQRHTCPQITCGCEILTCSCPSFQMQKPRQLLDSFHDPCKHIRTLIGIMGWESKMAEILASD